MIVYSVPLDKHSKFKITIKGIYASNRELCIVLCDRNNRTDKPTWEDCENDCSVSYCGYNRMYNLTGKTPTDSSTDPKGFDVGKEYFVEFWPGDKAHYYNEEGTLDLTGSFKDKEGPFHLWFKLYRYKTSFTVERLL